MSLQTLTLPLHLPDSTDCDRCISRLQDALSSLKGVAQARVEPNAERVEIAFDPDMITLSRIETQARQVGAELAQIAHRTLDLRDMDCPDCAKSIEKSVRRLEGMLWASVNFPAAQLHIEYDVQALTIRDIEKTVEGHGVRACALTAPRETAEGSHDTTPIWRTWWSENRRTVSTLAAVLLTGIGAVSAASGFASVGTVFYALAILFGGAGTARAAWIGLHARALDMNALMTVAVIGAASLGDWFEAATVVALFNVGNWLQASTLERTRRSIRALMSLSPPTARVRRNGLDTEVPVEQVLVGETLFVKPGERLPLDGAVLAGSSVVNEAPITGESVPKDKQAGDRVFAGTLNGGGVLTIEVTRPARDTTLARILHRVEEAQAQRAPSQQFIDRFARVYTPIVVALAVALAVFAPLVQHFVTGSALWQAAVWQGWLLRALSLLIIACPCALVISTPVAIVTAIGSASRHGVLIKGGVFLEKLGQIRAICFDKTGTLTQGKFRVETVEIVERVERVVDAAAEDAPDKETLLRIAAALESHSEHPLAAAIVAAAPVGSLPTVETFTALPGRGVRGVVAGKVWQIGTLRLLEEAGVALGTTKSLVEHLQAAGQTAILLADERQVYAVLGLADTPRPKVAEAVQALKSLGIQRQIMLTGDSEPVARSIAASAGLTEYAAALLPEQKLDRLREYREELGVVAMVGDGVNDAPALAGADVGIVMGAAGSDTAMETADVVLMSDDLSRLPFLLALSRRTRRIIQQNVAFSLGTKALLLVVAIISGIPLWLAVIGDVGVSLLVSLNALRLRQG